MEILYKDRDILVCVKPPRVLSTDEPGGLPELVRQELGDPKADVRTVHRLDRVVSGLMVLARNPAAASELSRQIREGTFQKEYLAVVHGGPSAPEGTFRDLLGRDKARKMTFVAPEPGKGIQEAVLDYKVLAAEADRAKVLVRLHTDGPIRSGSSLPPGGCPCTESGSIRSGMTPAKLPCGLTAWALPTPQPGNPWNLPRSRRKAPPGS